MKDVSRDISKTSHMKKSNYFEKYRKELDNIDSKMKKSTMSTSIIQTKTSHNFGNLKGTDTGQVNTPLPPF